MTTPAQAELAGMPPVQAPAHAEQRLKVGLVGTLQLPAVVRVAGERVLIDAVLRQHVPGHAQALPVWVLYAYPDLGCLNSTHIAAASKAAQLHAGTVVVALGHGLELVQHEGQPMLRLMDVLGLAPADDGATHHPHHGG